MAQDETEALGQERAAVGAGSWLWQLFLRFTFSFLIFAHLPFPAPWIPGTSGIAKAYDDFWHLLVPWVGKNVLGLATRIEVFTNGSGDTTYNWVLLLCHTCLAGVISVAWLVVDRRRRTIHRGLFEGLSVYLRYCLVVAMFNYALVKVFPLQFAAISYDELITPVGQLTPMRQLWTFMGGSAVYSFLSGFAELVSAGLLLFRRTALLGAILCLGVMANVVLLDFCYDVPVKIYACQVLLTALFIIAPDARRLLAVVLWNRPTEPRDLAMPVSRRWRIAAWVVKAIFVLYLGLTFQSLWATLERPNPLPPLYGLYEVEEFSRNGEEIPPLLSREDRWRYVVFNQKKQFTVHRVDNSVRRWRVLINPQTSQMAFKPLHAENIQILRFRLEEGFLLLAGNYEGEEILARLKRIEDPQFPLTSQSFHWIREYPNNP